MIRIARSSIDDQPKRSEGNVNVEPRGRIGEELDASESPDRCGDELASVIDEDWTHRVMNPRALSPTVGANVDGLDQR